MRAKLVKRMNKRRGARFKIRTGDISFVDTGEYSSEKEFIGDPEFGYFELNTQATKPFIAAYFVKTFLDSDTNVIAGDMIELDNGRVYLITVKNPDMLGNEVIRNLAISYRCNSQVVIYRKVTVENDETFESETSYLNTDKEINCLITEGFYGEEVEKVSYGDVTTDKQEMYIQNKAQVQLGDKVVISEEDSVYGGEKTLFVKKIKRRFYSGIDYCILTEED